MEQLLLLLTRIRIALRSCATQLADSQQARLLQMIADMLDEGHLDSMNQAAIFGFITYSYHPEAIVPMRKAFELRDIQRQSFLLARVVLHRCAPGMARQARRRPEDRVPPSEQFHGLEGEKGGTDAAAALLQRPDQGPPGPAPRHAVGFAGMGPAAPSSRQARNGTAVVATMAACPDMKSVGEVSSSWLGPRLA